MADWNPWQTLEMLRREIDNVFNETDARREPVFRAAFLPGRAARRYPLINLCCMDRGAVCRSPGSWCQSRYAQCERRGEHLEHRRRETARGWGRAAERSIVVNGPQAVRAAYCAAH